MSAANPSVPERPSCEAESFRLGAWLVSPATGEIASGGTAVRVEPKAMDLLVYLASRPGEVVSRQDLERHVWRGALVGYDAVTGTVIKLRKALGDSTREPHYIATVPKRGYRLIAPVSSAGADESLAASTDAGARTAAGRPRSPVARRVPTPVLLALLAAAVIGAALYLAYVAPPIGQRERPPSLVVLPFENLSEDPRQDQFADGMTEDLVTDLSRLSELLVMASNTTFALKGRPLTPRQAGEDLGVDFVLEGSVRRRGDSLRISAQLVDARSGFQRWAERYDRPTTQVFAVQDEVTSHIVEALAVNLTRQEKARLARRSTDNLAAYDRFLEGQRLGRIYTKEMNLQAQQAYRQAIELDPGYGRAYGALAYTLGQSYQRGWTDTPQLTADRALELAKKAVALDSSIPQTYWSLGYAHLMRQESVEAEEAASRAVTIAPNYSDGYALLALIENTRGEAQSALALIDKGMRLNPYFTWEYPYNRGRAYYALGRIDEAIAALEDARWRNANAVPVRIHLAASYARAGRLDEAEWEVQEILSMSPSDTISQLRHAQPIEKPELMEALVEDLRKAGLPE